MSKLGIILKKAAITTAYAGVVSLFAGIGWGTGLCWHSLEHSDRAINKSRYEKAALAKPENVSVMEQIIREESEAFFNVIDTPNDATADPKTEEQEAKNIFMMQTKPEIYELLHLQPTGQEPVITTGYFSQIPNQAWHIFFSTASLASLIALIALRKRKIGDSWSKASAAGALALSFYANALFLPETLFHSRIDVKPPAEYLYDQRKVVFNASEYDQRYDLAVILGHEYVHFLEDITGVLDSSQPKNEGFARVVEVEVAEKLAAKNKNRDFQQVSILQDLSELKGLYILMASSHFKEPTLDGLLEAVDNSGYGVDQNGNFWVNPYATGSFLIRAYMRETRQSLADVFKDHFVGFEKWVDEQASVYDQRIRSASVDPVEKK